jgi:hypothetical protein
VRGKKERKGKERERRGQRTQKAQKPKDTDWYSELLSRFGCATLHTVHTYTSHLIHTSHFTPHTSHLTPTPHTPHFTLHTSHFTPPLPPQPTRRGPPAAQGQAPLIPGRLPGCSLVLSDLRGLRGAGWFPLLLARACPGRTRTSQPPRCAATLNGARMLIFLWLAWWGSHVSIGTGPAHRGSPPPLQLRISQRHASLPLSPHNSDRTSGSDWR